MMKTTPDEAQAARHARLARAIEILQEEMDNLKAPNDEAPLTWRDVIASPIDRLALAIIEESEL